MQQYFGFCDSAITSVVSKGSANGNEILIGGNALGRGDNDGVSNDGKAGNNDNVFVVCVVLGVRPEVLKATHGGGVVGM